MSAKPNSCGKTWLVYRIYEELGRGEEFYRLDRASRWKDIDFATLDEAFSAIEYQSQFKGSSFDYGDEYEYLILPVVIKTRIA